MSLINDIRKNGIEISYKTTKKVFEPEFLLPLNKNGYYIISKESITHYNKECLAITRNHTNLHQWLDDNFIKWEKCGNMIKLFKP